jgi:hypothetical protein
MRMEDAQIISFLDQEDAWLRETIRRYGWAVQAVYGEGEAPPFAYTVGLTGFGHPELLVFGMSQLSACGVLNDLGERVRGGQRLQAGMTLGFDNWPHRVRLLTVADSSPILFAANRAYQLPGSPPVPALQAVWDDKGGRFPWDPGYSVPVHVQPWIDLPPA